MLQKKAVVVTGILLVLLVLVVFKSSQKSSPEALVPQEVHYHAGFLVFKDGKKEDFSDLKYMSMKPCEDENHEKKLTADEIQMEKAHLHGGVGDVLHVHVEGSKWKDIFINLDYEVDYSAASAYLNGNKVEGIEETPINPYDSLVLFLGETDEALIKEAVTRERIEEVESNSVECGS